MSNILLFNAIQSQDVKTVNTLLAQGANSNANDDHGNSVLNFAVITGNAEIVAALLQHGADPNLTRSYGNTVLHYAIYKENLKIIEDLLENGADLNAKTIHGNTVLHLALLIGNTEIIEMLLQHGADPNIKDDLGSTPLDHTGCTSKDKLCRLLINYGAKSTKRSNFLYLTETSPNYGNKNTLVSDLENLLDDGYLNLNPPDPELQDIIAERLTPELRVISDSTNLSMTVSSLVLRTLSVFSPFLIG